MVSRQSMIDIKSLEEVIDYQFKNSELIKMALTHSSHANESKDKTPFNERLEFLGDSVLSLSISEYLYTEYPDLPEGILTRIRAAVVSEPPLSQAARGISLGEFLLLGKGEEASGGRNRTSILADALEAIIGAVYLDGGFGSARSFVLKMLMPIITKAMEGRGFRDYKTELQELIQKETYDEIIYTIIDEKGPDHDKRFTAQISLGNRVLGEGEGKSKKEAEQSAAQNALKDKL